jgi:hypothetical protein
MKREMNLVREILLAIEADERSAGLTPMQIGIEGYTLAQIGYHLKILVDGKFIEAEDFSVMNSEYPELWPISLTWAGHEFLDSAKNESIWRKGTRSISDKVGSTSLAVLQSLLIHYAKQELGI